MRTGCACGNGWGSWETDPGPGEGGNRGKNRRGGKGRPFGRSQIDLRSFLKNSNFRKKKTGGREMGRGGRRGGKGGKRGKGWVGGPL